MPLLPVLLLLLLLVPALAAAHNRPDRRMIPARLQSLAAPERDAEGLSRMVVQGAVQQQYGADSHVLRRMWSRELPARPKAGAIAKPRAAAEDFLRANAVALGLASPDLAQELAFESEKQSPSGTHLRWNQSVGGVPVYRSEIVVKVGPGGDIRSVQNNLHPGLKVPTTPAVSGDAAIDAVRALVQPTGRELMVPKSTLMVVDTRLGAKLAWLVQMPVEAPMGDWWVFVDAQNGAVLGGEDRMVYAEGTGRVFDPDPMSKMSDSTYLDNSDADSAVPFPASYDIRPLHDITFSAGVYSLSGPYAQLIDDESPTYAPVTATAADSFRFQRSAQGFEDVMCYYHLDTSQRYIQSLGFTNINNRVQPVDSHGLSGADNSHYVPSTGHLAFGEGGIDDDEDADVIWHEYGHSIQDNVVPGWGGGEEGAMGEGWGDYWAASYSRALFPGFQYNRVFTWDGNGETWSGRLLIDTSLHWPEDCCGEVHDSGTLWCSALTDCWNHVGRAVMDPIVLDHHFALGTSATMADAAAQVIQSDIDLFGGTHVAALVARFAFWGMLDPADFIPVITHTPLGATENLAGPYAVIANVTSTQPLAAGFPKLYYGFGPAITDSVTMTPTANPNEFTANIPGPGVETDVRYYIRATDTNGGSGVAPASAPGTPYLFHVGLDVTPPAIVHTPITTVASLSWPPTVLATVTDALGVNTSSVQVSWAYNSVAQTPFSLTRVGLTNNYSGTFPALGVVPGDVVDYHITAADLALTPNTGRAPAVGEYTFTVSASLGTVLVLDDDIVAKSAETKVVADEKDPARTTVLHPSSPSAVMSANLISRWLSAMGFTPTVEPAATSNSATWPTYSFIVSTSGANTAPVASATYRAALEAYVAAGHKLLVEGGEVGYDAISYPAYPTFAANVLHGLAWSTDNGGALARVAAQAAHPLANIPNALPATIGITYSGYGNEDSYSLVAPAYAVYGTTTQAANAGVSVFDNNSAPQSAQIVAFAFDLKVVTDSTLGYKLLENAAHFLTAAEPPPTSTITGRVAVGAAWGGPGITVTLLPGGATTTTDAAGMFSFTPLYAGTYSVSATLAGYSGTPRNVVLADGATADVRLNLFPIASSNDCVNPALAIPDNNTTGITSVITPATAFTVASVQVGVNITHTWRGDLIVELRHGTTTVRLHNRTGSSADNIIGTYPTTLTVGGPGTLADFNGQSSAGAWTLFVSDNASSDTGTLNQWCLVLAGAADTSLTVSTDPSRTPLTLDFAPIWPNPARGGMTLSFTLPQSAAVKLALYDVTGRRVRTVAEREFAAGRTTLAFDGHDDAGAALRPGLYLARFQSGSRTITRSIVVLH